MRLPLRLRSRDEQRAIFSRLSYSDFNRKANGDLVKLVSERLHEGSFRDWSKSKDGEFKSGYPTTIKDIAFSDKTMKMKHTIYGGEQSYDRFWFETNKFSAEPDIESFDSDGDISSGAGVFSESAKLEADWIGYRKNNDEYTISTNTGKLLKTKNLIIGDDLDEFSETDTGGTVRFVKKNDNRKLSIVANETGVLVE